MLSLAFVSSFILTSLIPSLETDPAKFFAEVFDAVSKGNWKYVAALGVIALGFAARKWGSKLLPALSSGKWAWTMVVGIAVVGAVGNGLAADRVHSISDVLSVVLQGAFVGFSATGIWKGAKEWLKKQGVVVVLNPVEPSDPAPKPAPKPTPKPNPEQ